MKSERRWSGLVKGLGLVLLVALLLRSDLPAIGRVLLRAKPAWLVGASLLIFPMIAFKTARWRLLQRAVGISPGSFESSFRGYLEGLFAGLVTPGRLGEFVRIRSLTARGAPFAEAAATVVWDRIFDVLGLFILGAVALWPLAATFRDLYVAALVVMILGIAVAALLILLPAGRAGGFRERSVAALRRRSAVVGRLADSIGGLLAASRRFRGGMLAGVGLFTLGGWVVYYLQAWMLARAILLPIALIPLVVSVTAAAVATFIPITISGIGTRDAALVVLFTRLGLSREEALAFSALVLLMLIVNALVGFLAGKGGEKGALAGEMARSGTGL